VRNFIHFQLVKCRYSPHNTPPHFPTTVSQFQNNFYREVNDMGVIISGEQRLFDSQWPAANDAPFGDTPAACVQFSTHSTPTDIVKHGDKFVIALGDGAGFTGLDVGNLGTGNPCQDNLPFTGGT